MISKSKRKTTANTAFALTSITMDTDTYRFLMFDLHATVAVKDNVVSKTNTCINGANESHICLNKKTSKCIAYLRLKALSCDKYFQAINYCDGLQNS